MARSRRRWCSRSFPRSRLRSSPSATWSRASASGRSRARRKRVMAYLELEALSKHFKREKALDGLSLGIEKGEFLVVFGPSGSGKTVLLRLLAGVMEPTSGDIRLNGQSLLPLGPEKRDVAMAFQNFALYPHLSAFENIASPLRARRLEEAEVERRVREVAELLRIDHVLKHYPRELSNGQKQRTSLRSEERRVGKEWRSRLVWYH